MNTFQAQIMVTEDACQKYACACKIVTATKPARPIEKSTASGQRAGSGDRGQGGRSVAAAPAGEDVPALRHRVIGPDLGWELLELLPRDWTAQST
jgi:hypothetical protein